VWKINGLPLSPCASVENKGLGSDFRTSLSENFRSSGRGEGGTPLPTPQDFFGTTRTDTRSHTWRHASSKDIKMVLIFPQPVKAPAPSVSASGRIFKADFSNSLRSRRRRLNGVVAPRVGWCFQAWEYCVANRGNFRQLGEQKFAMSGVSLPAWRNRVGASGRYGRIGDDPLSTHS
jgi:hypothetical protein